MNNWTIDKLERSTGEEIIADVQVRAEKSQDEERTYTFTMSDEVMDRHGTIVKLDGANIEEYNRNPVVILMHQTSGRGGDYDLDNIVGKGYAFFDDDGLLKNRITFEPKELNAKAEKAVRKIEFGSLSAGSIGFVFNKGSWGSEERGEDPDIYYIREWTLIEYSIVSVPSNPNALIDKKEVKKEEVKEEKKEEHTVEETSPLSRDRANYKLRFLKLK